MTEESATPLPEAETPPAETPPTETPPAETPPAETPPAETPPAEGAPKADKDGNLIEDFSPEYYEADDSVPGAFLKVAGGLKLTKDQFDGMFKHLGPAISAQMKQAELAERQRIHDLGQQQLKAWGDSANTKLDVAKRGLKMNDPEGKFSEILDKTGYGSHPAVLQFLHNIGKNYMEGGFMKAPAAPLKDTRTRAQRMYPTASK